MLVRNDALVRDTDYKSQCCLPVPWQPSWGQSFETATPVEWGAMRRTATYCLVVSYAAAADFVAFSAALVARSLLAS